MSTLPKPSFCGQNWLEMTPTQGGRICGGCHKVVIDFSKKSWVEIEQMQRQHHNTLCGMYAPKQLEHWGREVPAGPCTKWVATSALLVSLTAASTVNGQTALKPDSTSRTIIRGTVTAKSKSGRIDTLDYAQVNLRGTPVQSVTNEFGQYFLDITDYIDTLPNPTLDYRYVGYQLTEVRLDSTIRGEVRTDMLLEENLTEVIYFSVAKPTFRQKVKWKFNKWFGRKEKE